MHYDYILKDSFGARITVADILCIQKYNCCIQLYLEPYCIA